MLQLQSNAGDVCFPGGKSEPGDPDDTSTALREAEEEIGLPPGRVEVCTLLEPLLNLVEHSSGGLVLQSFGVCSVFRVPPCLNSVPLLLNHRAESW